MVLVISDQMCCLRAPVRSKCRNGFRTISAHDFEEFPYIYLGTFLPYGRPASNKGSTRTLLVRRQDVPFRLLDPLLEEYPVGSR
jgi:hypothetical protein